MIHRKTFIINIHAQYHWKFFLKLKVPTTQSKALPERIILSKNQKGSYSKQLKVFNFRFDYLLPNFFRTEMLHGTHFYVIQYIGLVISSCEHSIHYSLQKQLDINNKPFFSLTQVPWWLHQGQWLDRD